MISPDAEPLRLAKADSTYQLSVDDRAQLARGFDADALERLLREVRPDMRGEILAHFQVSASGARRGHLMEIHDPHLQAILEEVWAPMWDDASAEAIEQGWFEMPGREIARARRCRL
ncbi:MAG TPA: hypothetical protein VLK84_13075 [Longimicrobium sp.]|nr:hypothetical protein [Longimicrobium sp.]